MRKKKQRKTHKQFDLLKWNFLYSRQLIKWNDIHCTHLLRHAQMKSIGKSQQTTHFSIDVCDVHFTVLSCRRNSFFTKQLISLHLCVLLLIFFIFGFKLFFHVALVQLDSYRFLFSPSPSFLLKIEILSPVLSFILFTISLSLSIDFPAPRLIFPATVTLSNR